MRDLQVGNSEMAVFRIVTFLIHAITLAFASLLTAVFAHMVPALLAAIVLLGVMVAVMSCAGLSGIALLRRRKRDS